MICDRCTATFDPPVNRPSWAKCYACTMSPAHARVGRFGPAPAYPLPAPSLTQVTFVVPGPPTSKNRAGAVGVDQRTGKARYYVNYEAKKFQYAVAMHALAACGRLAADWKAEPRFSEGHFLVDYICYFDRDSADATNPINLAQDALQGVLFKNDKQCIRVTTEKQIDKVAPRLVVTVRAA